MLENGADDYNYSMSLATYSGHIDIVELMLEKGADNYNWSMRLAAKGGHVGIVELMLERGATDYDWGMTRAIEGGGHIDIVKLMLEKGATTTIADYVLIMQIADEGGNSDIDVSILYTYLELYLLLQYYQNLKK